MAGTCIDLKEDLSCYLDNELEGGRKAEVASHLLECEDCRKEYDNLKAVSSLFSKGPGSPSLPVPDIWESLSKSLPGTCEVLKEDLSAYLDGELPLAAQEGVNDHLKACSPCAADFKRLNQTNQLISAAMELPPGVEVDLWSAVKSRLNEDCALIRSELSVFADQEVPTLRHRAITAHLLECPDCQREFNQLSQVGDLVRAHYQPSLPENFDLWPEIKRAINVIPISSAERAKPNVVTVASRKPLALFAAACVAVGLAGAFTFVVNTPSGKKIEPVSAEAYLLESAMMEPADSAEAVVYENN
jgi:anti-sigma factor RsiW